jgi:DNA-binding SARP family transcriptional activator/tetratricopeptide (TPR) repeat protein
VVSLPTSNGERLHLTAKVLGPIRIWRNGEEIDLRPRQARTIAGLLLVQNGQQMQIDELVTAIWPEQAPSTARNIIQQHIGSLRRFLEPDLPLRESGRWIQRTGTGYRFVTDDVDLDLARSRRLSERASAEAQRGEHSAALGRSLGALQLWQHWSANTLDAAILDGPIFTRLDNELSRLAADAADLAIASGDPGSALPQLLSVADRRLLDEPLQARILLCLAAAGRQNDALRRYARVRQTLHDELGVHPGTELSAAWDRLHQLAPRAAGQTPLGATPPSQLPADLPVFIGRREQLGELSRLANTNAASSRSDAVVVTINGMPGVGKSTLAVHWAHHAAPLFPDGQIYIDLRGYRNGGPMEAAEAIQVLLSALGCPVDQVPSDFAAQVGLYRTLLNRRRVLMLFDNASSTEHVADLIPGAPGCMTVITSRTKLTALAARGAHGISLGLLSEQEARRNISLRIGPARAAREPAALAEIARRCAGLPLALAIAGARIAGNPSFSLDAVRQEMAEHQTSLDGFSYHDDRSDLRGVFSWSYQALSPDVRRLFRLLALHDSVGFGIDAAASLCGTPREQALPMLRALTEARMLNEIQPGRYAMHSLLLAYARELGSSEESPVERRAAQGRLFLHYWQMAYRACVFIWTNQQPEEPPPVGSDIAVSPIPDARAAADWLSLERLNLSSIITAEPADQPVWKIATMLVPFWQGRHLYREWAQALEVALAAARRQGDRLGEARSLRNLAGAYMYVTDPANAISCVEDSIGLFEMMNSRLDLALAHRNLATLRLAYGAFGPALKHLDDARSYCDGHAEPALEGSIRAMTAHCYARLDRHAEAVAWAKTAVEILGSSDTSAAHQNGLVDTERYAWNVLGLAQTSLGDHKSAIAATQNLIRIAEMQGGRINLADAHWEHSKSLHAAGDVEGARQQLEIALSYAEEQQISIPEYYVPNVDAIRRRLAEIDPSASP